MMRRMAMICLATACSAAAVLAQAPPTTQSPTTTQAPTTMAKDQMKDHDKMKSGTVMVTGCVADKDTSGHYMLNNATTAGGADATAAGAQPMSYALSGGDLKAHVGHKVEVSGTVEPAKPAKIDKGGKVATDKMAPTMGDASMANTLKVKSVKMVAASCS